MLGVAVYEPVDYLVIGHVAVDITPTGKQLNRPPQKGGHLLIYITADGTTKAVTTFG